MQTIKCAVLAAVAAAVSLSCGSATQPFDAGQGGGSAGGAASEDGGTVDAGSDAGAPDAGATDAGITEEREPNDANAMGELDAITAPGARGGAIGTANDRDVYLVTLTVGQRWSWSLDATGTQLSPHLTVSEAMNAVPVLLARGSVGAKVGFDQVVLKSGTYVVQVRDGRNVPQSSSQNVGSPAHRYVLSVAPATQMPKAIAVPSSLSETLLPDRFASAWFTFTLTQSTPVTVRALSRAKQPPSDLDPRLTLFDLARSHWLLTNDDESLGMPDSKVTGTLEPGDYLIEVRNMSESASDLTYWLNTTSP